jgi:hypothetical protein
LINYVDRLSDLYTTTTLDWVEGKDHFLKNKIFIYFNFIVSFPVDPGFYTFLWQYNKLINSNSDPSAMILKLEMIEFEGIQADNDHSLNILENFKKENNRPQCLAIPYNFGCAANFYFDQVSNKCLACPEGYYSLRKSTGQESCKKKPPCQESDYISYKNNLCSSNDQAQKTQLVEYFYNTPFNCEESSGVKKPENKIVPCCECQIGQFRKTISGSKNSICEYCPIDTYSDELNTQGYCKKCEDGYTPKIFQIIQGNFYKDIVDSLYFTNKNWTIHNNNLAVKQNDFSESNPPKLEMNVTITEPSGNIQIKYEIFTDNVYNFTIKIYNYDLLKTEYLQFFSSKSNYTFQQDLQKAKYKISLELNRGSFDPNSKPKLDINKSNQPIILLESLIIKNSLLGGGYACSKCPEDMVINHSSNSCVKCPSGTEINSETKNCVPCKEGYYRDSKSDSLQCMKCPDMSTSNSNKNDCILLDVMQNKNSSLRYIINDLYETEQKIICDSGDSLCYGNFLGPISSNSELFFLSFREKSTANFSDFSYEIKNTDSNNLKGFVFSLKKEHPDKTDKSLVNMGKDFSYIRLFGNRKGLAIKYSEGDVCQEDSNQRYSTILLIKCFKEFDSIYSVESPRLLTKINNNCTNVLEWRSRHACPSCLKSEALSLAVRKNFKKIFIKICNF